MSTEPKTTRQFEALLQQRAESSEPTRLKLHHALDRFEHDQLLILPPGSKLTIRNLALEADVSKDTPLSRYRKDQPNGGDYRFPDIVARFNKLKTRKHTRPSGNNLKEAKIQELRQIIESSQEKNLLLARANNQLDIRAVELERRCRELEEQNARLRQECLKIVPYVRSLTYKFSVLAVLPPIWHKLVSNLLAFSLGVDLSLGVGRADHLTGLFVQQDA
jgi:hypothetical protein